MIRRTSNLRNLGERLEIPITADEDGYIGRECPVESCLGYFKVRPGTGLSGISHCICAYCGTREENSKFFTQDQIEYAKSVAKRKIIDAVRADLREAFRPLNRQRGGLLNIRAEVRDGQLPPIHRYKEKSLETHVICAQCGLDFAVYGVFGHCPDCGSHNSLQIFLRNLELVSKMLALANTTVDDVRQRLVENALEDCVSAFDGFGRAVLLLWNGRPLGDKPSLQNIATVKEKLLSVTTIDISSGIPAQDWLLIIRSFQKRHLLAHKMGVIDEEYVRKASDMGATVGRKIGIDGSEVAALLPLLQTLAATLSAHIAPPK